MNNCSSAVRKFRLLGWPAAAAAAAEGAVEPAAASPASLLLHFPESEKLAEPVELLRGEYSVEPAAAGRRGDGGRVFGQPDEVAPHVQSFAVPAGARGVRVDRVALEVEDNHGDPHFTCIYHPVLYGDP